MTTLSFGEQTRFELDLCDFTLLGAERELNPALTDPAAAVVEALANPQGFPALGLATIPGDRVAVSIDAEVPQMASILRGAIAALLEANVAPAMITVVSTGQIEHRDQLEGQLAGMGASAVRFELHDPDDERALAMIGVSGDGEPVRLNRTVAEADFVLPIGVGRLPANEHAPLVKFASLFPQFSSREARERAQLQAVSESAKQRKRLAASINEAGWLLGVGMTVSVVPGAEGGVAVVLAGDPETVARESRARSQAIWERTAEQQGDLVIAALTGDHREQTWENVARALSAAAAMVEPGGATALCTELDEPPSGSMTRLLEAVDFGEVQQELAQDNAVEAHPAMVLARALESGPVYLRSRLPADVVVSLGMTPIEDDEELSRLAAHRHHCVVIEEAQRVLPKLAVREDV
jgi:nickel-dependent lactate racemase